MPQIIFRYDTRRFNIGGLALETLGKQIIPLVAELTNCPPEHPIGIQDVEWLPQAYPPSAIGPIVAIEIRTFGYTQRVLKMNNAAMLELKMKILGFQAFISQVNKDDAGKPLVDPEEPLIWLMFVNGVHV